jgi:hypothetical protein
VACQRAIATLQFDTPDLGRVVALSRQVRVSLPKRSTNVQVLEVPDALAGLEALLMPKEGFRCKKRCWRLTIRRVQTALGHAAIAAVS